MKVKCHGNWKSSKFWMPNTCAGGSASGHWLGSGLVWRDVWITRTRYEATDLETKVADRSTICLQDYAAWLANRETSIAMCRAGDVMLFWGGMGDWRRRRHVAVLEDVFQPMDGGRLHEDSSILEVEHGTANNSHVRSYERFRVLPNRCCERVYFPGSNIELNFIEFVAKSYLNELYVYVWSIGSLFETRYSKV